MNRFEAIHHLRKQADARFDYLRDAAMHVHDEPDDEDAWDRVEEIQNDMLALAMGIEALCRLEEPVVTPADAEPIERERTRQAGVCIDCHRQGAGWDSPNDEGGCYECGGAI